MMSVRHVTKVLQKNKHVIICCRNATTHPHPLQEKYKHFQQEDGIPVYQKGGFGDRILFQFTILLTVIGIADGFSTLFSMAFKKKK